MGELLLSLAHTSPTRAQITDMLGSVFQSPSFSGFQHCDKN